jgi:hypothetical protein
MLGQSLINISFPKNDGEQGGAVGNFSCQKRANNFFRDHNSPKKGQKCFSHP